MIRPDFDGSPFPYGDHKGEAQAQIQRVWVENIKTIVYAGLIAVGVRTVAFEPFNIPPAA